MRGWTRDDWGAEGRTMAWCCTEGERAYVGDRPVVESLGEELQAIVGPTVYVELRPPRSADLSAWPPQRRQRRRPASAASLLSEVWGRAPRWPMTSAAARLPNSAQSAGS